MLILRLFTSFIARIRALAPRYAPFRLCSVFLAITMLFNPTAGSQQGTPIHGLWVWTGPSILQTPSAIDALRDFCRANQINEVYVSVSQRGEMMQSASMARMILPLHQYNIRVEALLSSESADEGGKHLEKLLAEVRTITRFDQEQSRSRFDGIHLDIEPQQRLENKGPGNLRFLPGLVQAYRAVRDIAEPAGLSVNADVQNKLLKGDVAQRTMLLSSLPRFTLMMYELSSPRDGDDTAAKAQKVRDASKKFLDMAYEGLSGQRFGKMVIGLRTPDYEDQLTTMLRALDEADGSNAHYAGWARHSYNDTLPAR
jgi:hypothetical protein